MRTQLSPSRRIPRRTTKTPIIASNGEAESNGSTSLLSQDYAALVARVTERAKRAMEAERRNPTKPGKFPPAEKFDWKAKQAEVATKAAAQAKKDAKKGETRARRTLADDTARYVRMLRATRWFVGGEDRLEEIAGLLAPSLQRARAGVFGG